MKTQHDLYLICSCLTIQEKLGVQCVLRNLEGKEEGVITTSRVAAENGISKSTIVNALQKLKASGVVFCKSQGVKGTYIRVNNTEIIEALTEVY